MDQPREDDEMKPIYLLAAGLALGATAAQAQVTTPATSWSSTKTTTSDGAGAQSTYEKNTVNSSGADGAAYSKTTTQYSATNPDGSYSEKTSTRMKKGGEYYWDAGTNTFQPSQGTSWYRQYHERWSM
jgi:hypothetical protein